MNIPKVTIITVVLNGEAHIECAIKSVLAQTYNNIQYIIIDGQSTDGTLAIVNRYKEKLILISEPDSGIYAAMNKGLQLADGELIGILNSDDCYEPNTVELVVHAANEHPSYDIYHGLLRWIDEDQISAWVLGHHHSFLKHGMIEHPTCFVRKAVYDTIGHFDADYAAAADYAFMLKAFNHGKKFYFLERILASFRSGGISGSFRGAVETLTIRHKFGFISANKRRLLTAYWWLRTRQ
ncbi:MAG TPA: glycosyltransferase family 2 protein [Pedobacter sp.]|uniref:glycosyltransferase family 2 protein n=1 Tax=Pedobacter sp. TaxID=1411316 RepID=UPI002B8727EB|nr:glycosyltransferase family 2 protein [Pedobacter sp.]HMI00867.1 glycosyltransferase family 2 protein [Pedobacter sp.]